jgi:thiol:disulfide interchange protein DsbD
MRQSVKAACLLFKLLIVVVAAPASGQIDPDDLLPVDEAFSLEAVAEPGQVRLVWNIAEGYYLYRHAFSVSSDTTGADLGPLRIPPGEPTRDEFFGETETYRDRVALTLPIMQRPSDGDLLLEVRSQGCADLGVCYPPNRQQIRLTLPPSPEPGLGSLLRNTNASDSELFDSGGDALPAEQAFTFEAIAGDAASLLVRFTSRPGYYLYRDQFEFLIGDPAYDIVQVMLPPAVPIHDESFGDTHVYFGEVEIPVQLARPAGPAEPIEVTARFQGCLEGGICYPPMSRAVTVDLPAADAAVRPPEGAAEPSARESVRSPQSDAGRLQRMIEEQPLALTLGLFVLLGAGLAFTPCVFPMVPILSGIIAGEGEGVTRAKAFSLSLVYVLVMAMTYTAVGVIAALAGYNLQAAFQNPWVLLAFAAIFVALALAMFGFYNLQMPASLQAKLTDISNRQSGGSLIGAGIMGFFSALIVGPCVTAPLIGVLGFIAMTGDAVLGGSVLFALSIGMGLPLLAVGVGLGSWLPRAGEWMDAVKSVFGVGLLALAIWMLSRVLPGAVTMLLWGALAIGCAVYLGALARLPVDASGWRKLWQGLGIMLLVVGVIQFIGALSGGRDWLRPLHHLQGASAGPAVAAPAFRTVATLPELESALAASRSPVLLDFYADWCIDCVRMERRTFPDPEVARRLSEMTLLKVDVTDYTRDDQAILERFGIVGPPAYLFFDQGEELRELRTFGFRGPARFVALLDEVGR